MPSANILARFWLLRVFKESGLAPSYTYVPGTRKKMPRLYTIIILSLRLPSDNVQQHELQRYSLINTDILRKKKTKGLTTILLFVIVIPRT